MPLYLMRSCEDGFSSGGTIVVDICLLSQLCNKFCVSFVKRDGNLVAHALAKFAKSIPDFIV